ncbi:MAG: hypothetical protein ACI8RD_000254, partial [Bacillariaceae sp.]
RTWKLSPCAMNYYQKKSGVINYNISQRSYIVS